MWLKAAGNHRQRPWVRDICNLWIKGLISNLPLMRIIYGVSTLLSVLMWVSDWPAHASAADTGGEYRFDGSKSQPTGSVVGRVGLVGAYERPPRLKVFKNRDFCGPWVANESLLVSSAGGVQNTVVLLQPTERQVRVQPTSIVLDNRNCAFTPHVQVAPLGSELRLKNSDPILHTVHARLGTETLFNVGLPRWRQVIKSLTRSGIIKIDCDVLHTWMSAAIVVTQSPYYAVTDQDGHFVIERLPVGEYQMETWHERLGSKKQRIFVLENAQSSVEVVYRFDQKVQ
jgi:hypothetical protein